MNKLDFTMWYAVLVVIDAVEVSDSEASYGRVNGKLCKVDIEHEGVMYSVFLKCGESLKDFAQEYVEKHQGVLISVYSKGGFDILDIDLSLLDQALVA